MDLVRGILLAIEAAPGGFAPSRLTVDGFTEEQVGYHVMLMAEAGLLIGTDATPMGGESPHWIAAHLTWSGHEFLDAARNDTTWNKAKSAVGGVAGFSLEILKSVLVNYGTSEAMRVMAQP